MEHPPRAYTTVQHVVDGMDRTIMGEVVREVLQHEAASLPLDVICVARTGVQLILTPSMVERSR